jgi:hypothetical protein
MFAAYINIVDDLVAIVNKMPFFSLCTLGNLVLRICRSLQGVVLYDDKVS